MLELDRHFFGKNSMKPGDHLLLIDGSSYIFRAYYALSPLFRKRDGLPIGAVSGFCNMLWKLLLEVRKKQTEKAYGKVYFAVIFDYSSETFRKKIYPAYKANRKAPPEDLIPQFSLVRKATTAFNVPYIEKEGFEADDIIATYTSLAIKVGTRVTIISSDKDLMQLVNSNVCLYDSMRNKYINTQEVFDKWGVFPEKMIDFQAMMGDKTDNIPGIAGIGPKTAARLIEKFGDLDTLLANIKNVSSKKLRETIAANAHLLQLSRNLVRLRQDVPLDRDLNSLCLEPQNNAKLISFLKTMDLNSLVHRVADETQMNAHNVNMSEKSCKDLREVITSRDTFVSERFFPSIFSKAYHKEMCNLSIKKENWKLLQTEEELQNWLEKACERGFFSFRLETDSQNPMNARLIGFSIALSLEEAAYVPLLHNTNNHELKKQIEMSKALDLFKPVLENPSILKISENIKHDLLVLHRRDLQVKSFDDITLMSYVLEAGRNHFAGALSKHWLSYKPVCYEDIVGKGHKALAFSDVSLEKALVYAAESAAITLQVWHVLKPFLVAERLVHIYERLEKPLVEVLARMEERGITIDRKILADLSAKFSLLCQKTEREIYTLSGKQFNIASPKQLSVLLFEQMRLPGGSKTKTGQWSTSVQVLKELASSGSLFPKKIVTWRQLKKLQSTYTDSLPCYINSRTNRIHTHYIMASTATGRLTSLEPNLQNIPIRTLEGRKIRNAFVACPGKILLSADYSQIELRILAHVANSPALRSVFLNNIDIHAMTASEIFNISAENMPAALRRRAKAINFGIIYGISAFGLANQLNISPAQARKYIHTYFEQFPGIKEYMERTKEFARKKGYVETIFGRRIHYPDIISSNARIRALNERAAINAPIQGTAADIIRRAMIRMDTVLQSAQLECSMLLQVHDELVFEAAEKDVEQAQSIIRKIMEGAALPAANLSVPLRIELRAAKNWNEAH